MKKNILFLFALIMFISSEENLIKNINKYYKELNQHAQNSAKKHSLSEAYENLARLPELENFLTFQGLVVEKSDIKIARSQSNKQLGFFYPAALYEKNEALLAALDPLKNSQLTQKIKQLENSLQNVLLEKKDKDKALKTIGKTIDKLNAKRKKAAKKFEAVKEKAELLESRLARGEERLLFLRSAIRKNADEELELIAVIRRFNSDIARELDDIRRLTLIRRRDVFERQRRTIQAEEDQFFSEARNLQNQLKRDERELQLLQRALPKLEKAANESVPEAEKLEEERDSINQRLDEIAREINPLTILRSQKNNIAGVVDEYQKWWSTAKHRPKYHLLLALYALDKLPEENYKVEEKKWIGIGGIVEVHFR